MAKAPDAFAAGGIVKINTDLLKNFATMNLSAFLDELDKNVDLKQMVAFATHTGAAPVGPSRHFTSALPGNGAVLGSADDLKSGFHDLATYVHTAMLSLVENAENMKDDLMDVADIIDLADHEAGLTAAQMRTDLTDVNGSSSGSTT